MSTKKLYIDLTKLNLNYHGGATRFALGLASALPEAIVLNPGDRPEYNSIIINPLCKINFFDPQYQHILCIHDIQHEVHPENFSVPRRLWRKYQYRKSARAAWKIQVSSYAIWDDLTRYLNIQREKVFYAPEGYNDKLWAPKLPSYTRWQGGLAFVYYPANFWKHKNHKTVIEGLAKYNKTAASRVSLVLTGKDYGEGKNIKELARYHNLPLINLGIVDEIEMRGLYKNAICTIAAGYYESGSLPIKEALACGGRVLAANIGPNLEMLGIPDLWHFETLSPESFAVMLETVRTSNKAGYRSITDYRWSKIAYIYRWIING